MNATAEEEEMQMPRGRRPKVVKAPTKLERAEKLREQIVPLVNDLMNDSYAALLEPPGPAQPITDPM